MDGGTNELEDAISRRREQLKHLASAPLIELSGIVSALGPSGSKIGLEDFWMLRLTLDAWRIVEGDIQATDLVLIRKVTKDELSKFQESITPYAVLRVRARIIENLPQKEPRGLLEQIVELESSDAELQLRATQLQIPITYEDAVFGTLTLDRRVNWYTASPLWNGKPVTLNMTGDETVGIPNALETGRALWQNQILWDQRIKEYAVARLLPLKNDAWRNEDDKLVGTDEFLARIKLEAITVYADGSFEFWHNDGELFWGHAIQITGNLLDGPTGADIPG